MLWITAISITHQAIRCTLVSPPLPAPRRTRSGAVHSAEPEGVGQNYIYARMDIASQRPAGEMCPQTSLAASTAYKPYDISVSHDSPRATVRDTGYVHTRPSGLAVWVIPLRPSKINVHATCVMRSSRLLLRPVYQTVREYESYDTIVHTPRGRARPQFAIEMMLRVCESSIKRCAVFKSFDFLRHQKRTTPTSLESETPPPVQIKQPAGRLGCSDGVCDTLHWKLQPPQPLQPWPDRPRFGRLLSRGRGGRGRAHLLAEGGNAWVCGCVGGWGARVRLGFPLGLPFGWVAPRLAP